MNISGSKLSIHERLFPYGIFFDLTILCWRSPNFVTQIMSENSFLASMDNNMASKDCGSGTFSLYGSILNN